METLHQRNQLLSTGYAEFKRSRPKLAVVPENIKRVQKIVLKDRKVKLRVIADTLKISKGSVFTILHSMKTMVKLNELRFELLPHPPYSPNLAPSDYWLFADIKKTLQGKKFIPLIGPDGWFSDGDTRRATVSEDSKSRSSRFSKKKRKKKKKKKKKSRDMAATIVETVVPSRRWRPGLLMAAYICAFVLWIDGTIGCAGQRPINIGGAKKRDVYIAGFFPYGSHVPESHIGRGVMPSVKLAVDHINEDRSVLRNYRLHMWWNDTEFKSEWRYYFGREKQTSASNKIPIERTIPISVNSKWKTTLKCLQMHPFYKLHRISSFKLSNSAEYQEAEDKHRLFHDRLKSFKSFVRRMGQLAKSGDQRNSGKSILKIPSENPGSTARGCCNVFCEQQKFAETETRSKGLNCWTAPISYCYLKNQLLLRISLFVYFHQIKKEFRHMLPPIEIVEIFSILRNLCLD
ncbi:Histone-lysine N-methyltransferase SETMAR [Melipona quadrifasciata]|uniref:Histone-lysine N-methyltransferase SETMAR n=1 Tax=Melipona quadrifasciata TaxID=166423 RepID=A0A0N0U3L9_9HYME|nr:Histone-lysine N-methyltransferase SETMAR [Melipona quadrifasciata]